MRKSKFVPAVLRASDRFELEREAYQRGADAARREDAEIVREFAEAIHNEQADANEIAAAILAKIGQPVKDKEK